jgi:hypothetical protein
MTKAWGPITWIFIHSFLEQINEKCFLSNKNTIIEFLRNICLNLPCQDCSNHAKNYINRQLKINNINNKEQLKSFFFRFHNNVNARLKKPIFYDFDKYKTSKLQLIFENFEKSYSNNYNKLNGFHNNMFRKQTIKKIKSFLNNNKNDIKWL